MWNRARKGTRGLGEEGEESLKMGEEEIMEEWDTPTLGVWD